MNSIQLSDALLSRLNAVIEEHEPAAKSDASITVQYLAAIVGFMTAEFPGPQSEKEDYLDQLHALAKHVLNDRVQAQAKAAAAPPTPAGRIEPDPDNPAMGVWRAHKA